MTRLDFQHAAASLASLQDQHICHEPGQLQVSITSHAQLITQQLPASNKVNQDFLEKKKSLLFSKLGQFKHSFTLHIKPSQKRVIT